MFKDMRDRLITKTLSRTTGRYITLKPRTPTVAANFSESLLSLIDTMSRCNPYFVRCVKPNITKQPMMFERNVVLDQLRYTGMLETIRIRKLGFPIRIKFPNFIDRYVCLQIIKVFLLNSSTWIIDMRNKYLIRLKISDWLQHVLITLILEFSKLLKSKTRKLVDK